MWCLNGLKSRESSFLELTGREKPWVIFTASDNLHSPTQFLSAATVSVKHRGEELTQGLYSGSLSWESRSNHTGTENNPRECSKIKEVQATSPLLTNCATSKQQLWADLLFYLLRAQTTEMFPSWSLNKLEVFVPVPSSISRSRKSPGKRRQLSHRAGGADAQQSPCPGLLQGQPCNPSEMSPPVTTALHRAPSQCQLSDSVLHNLR